MRGASGGFMVPAPVVSDMPQISLSPTPSPRKNSISSGAAGAAPMWQFARSSPSARRIEKNVRSSASATLLASWGGTGSPRCSRRTFSIASASEAGAYMGASASSASARVCSFSQMRGTAKNHDGLTSGR